MNRDVGGPCERGSGQYRGLRMGAALVLPLMLALIISACDSSGVTPIPAARVHVTATPSRFVPDPVEKAETTAAGQLPSFAKSNAAVQVLYQGALDHPEVYGQMACYCGCAIYEHPHTSLMSCFINSKAADGAITWTDHSTSCDICTGIAKMTLAGVQAQTPLGQLREAIHQKYKYTGVWTDTPLPAQ